MRKRRQVRGEPLDHLAERINQCDLVLELALFSAVASRGQTRSPRIESADDAGSRGQPIPTSRADARVLSEEGAIRDARGGQELGDLRAIEICFRQVEEQPEGARGRIDSREAVDEERRYPCAIEGGRQMSRVRRRLVQQHRHLLESHASRGLVEHETSDLDGFERFAWRREEPNRVVEFGRPARRAFGKEHALNSSQRVVLSMLGFDRLEARFEMSSEGRSRGIPSRRDAWRFAQWKPRERMRRCQASHEHFESARLRRITDEDDAATIGGRQERRGSPVKGLAVEEFRRGQRRFVSIRDPRQHADLGAVLRVPGEGLERRRRDIRTGDVAQGAECGRREARHRRSAPQIVRRGLVGHGRCGGLQDDREIDILWHRQQAGMKALPRSDAPRELVGQLHLDREVARVSEKRTPEERAQDVIGDDDVNRQEGVSRPELFGLPLRSGRRARAGRATRWIQSRSQPMTHVRQGQ